MTIVRFVAFGGLVLALAAPVAARSAEKTLVLVGNTSSQSLTARASGTCGTHTFPLDPHIEARFFCDEAAGKGSVSIAGRGGTICSLTIGAANRPDFTSSSYGCRLRTTHPHYEITIN